MAVGRCALSTVSTAINQDVKALIDLSAVEPAFFIRALALRGRELDRVAIGSTVKGISTKQLLGLQLRYPSVDEQARISAVLDAVDDAIEQTEAVIAKLKNAKEGLTLNCFAADNRDRSGWRDFQLKDCYLQPSRNGLYKKPHFYGRGIRMAHMPDLFMGMYVSAETAARVDVTEPELDRFGLEEGDLLFARRSLNLEGAGLSVLVPRLSEPLTFESSVVRVRLNRDIVDPEFALRFLRSSIAWLDRRRFIRHVAVSGVSGEDIGRFRLPCPPIAQQVRFLEEARAVDALIATEHSLSAKLDMLRQGLAADLLLGQVRTPPDLGLT